VPLKLIREMKANRKILITIADVYKDFT